MNTAATKATLLNRIGDLRHIPPVPAVVGPPLRCLQQPFVQRVTEMIAQDKSLAVQRLQTANSPDEVHSLVRAIHRT